jgi:hypothetical protein
MLELFIVVGLVLLLTELMITFPPMLMRACSLQCVVKFLVGDVLYVLFVTHLVLGWTTWENALWLTVIAIGCFYALYGAFKESLENLGELFGW